MTTPQRICLGPSQGNQITKPKPISSHYVQWYYFPISDEQASLRRFSIIYYFLYGILDLVCWEKYQKLKWICYLLNHKLILVALENSKGIQAVPKLLHISMNFY